MWNNSIEFNIMTFNVSNPDELASHLCKNQAFLSKSLDSSTNQFAKDLAVKILNIDNSIPLLQNPELSDPEKNFIRDYAKMEYQEFSKRLMHQIHDQFAPKIICLQEVDATNFPAQEEMLRVINELGYEVINQAVREKNNPNPKDRPVTTRDCVVAYKKDSFAFKKAVLTKEDALTVDLIHSESNRCIRIVSDHVAGFNSSQFLQDPSEIKIDAGQEVGDRNLSKTLAKVDQLTSNFLEKTFSNKPSGIIYCLDANSTISGLQEELHPKRLEQLEEHGFVTDHQAPSPTTFDASTNLAMCFDYVFVKGENSSVKNLKWSFPDSSGQTLTSLQERTSIIGEIFFRKQTSKAPQNDKERIEKMNMLMSDHLPVISHVTF